MISDVPWHVHKSFLSTGWCHGNHYPSALPDIGAVAQAGKAKVLSDRELRGGGRVSDVPATPTLPCHELGRPIAAPSYRLTKPLDPIKVATYPTNPLRNFWWLDPAEAPGADTLSLGGRRDLEPQELVTQALSTPLPIRRLCLNGTRLSDEALQDIVSASPSLRSLNISECFELTDLSPLHTLEDLSELCVSRCIKAVTSEFISGLKVNRKLSTLDISFCSNFTNQALSDLASKCRGLVRLNLSGCSQLAGQAFVDIVTSNSGITHLSIALNSQSMLSNQCMTEGLESLLRLVSLDLMGVSQLHSKTLKSIFRCERLEELSVAGCYLLDDRVLRQTVEAFPKIRKLDVYGCANLTSEGVIEAIPLGSELKLVNLGHLPHVSDETVVWLQSCMPKCIFRSSKHETENPNDLTRYLGGPVPEPKEKKKKAKAAGKSKGKR